MSSASMSLDTGSQEGSGPYGRILYFDPDPQTAKLTIVGLQLAGYDVAAAVALDDVRSALAAVEIGSQPLLAVVIDACSDAAQAESCLLYTSPSPRDS